MHSAMARFSRRNPTESDLLEMGPDELFATLMQMRRRGETELEALCALHFAFRIMPSLEIKARLNNPANEVDDIVAETIERIVASSKRPTARFRRSTAAQLTAWMYEIQSNVIADRHRRAARRKAIDDQLIADGQVTIGRRSGGQPDDHSEIEAGRSDDGYAEIEEDMLVDAILEGLNPDHRQVVALRYGERMPSKEVAEATGLSAANVDQIMSRFMAQLREALTEAGMAPASAGSGASSAQPGTGHGNASTVE